MLRKVGPASREEELLHGKEIREALGYTTRQQWVDFCLLCGCDFIEGIRGLGPVTAHKLMQQYGTIESILNSDALDKQRRSITPPADVASYTTDIEAARAIYLTPMPVDDITKEELQLQDEGPNIKSIMRGLDLDLDRIEMRSGFKGTPLDNVKHSWELISKKPLDLQVWISLSRKDKDSQQPCQTTMFIDARSPDRSRTFSSGTLMNGHSRR